MRNKHQRRNANRRRRGRHVFCNHGRNHWGKFGAAGVLVECDGYVLLAQRSFSLSKKGQWTVPGGALAARWEEPVSGAMRELFEEVHGFNVFDFKLVGHDTVGCECGWAYTTFRVSVPDLVTVYVGDWETRRVAWVPVEMVENMNLLSAFRRYWKSHSRMIAAESTPVDRSEWFADQHYDYDLDEHYSQGYYDKKGESRFERTHTSYKPGSYTVWGSSYKAAPKAEGGAVTGQTTPQFSDNNYKSSSYANKYTGDNGFHYSPVDYSDGSSYKLPVDYDADWADLEPSDRDFEQAEIDDQLVDLDDLVEADWETINDSILDAIDKAMIESAVF